MKPAKLARDRRGKALANLHLALSRPRLAFLFLSRSRVLTKNRAGLALGKRDQRGVIAAKKQQRSS
jgi:hypothetical protein